MPIYNTCLYIIHDYRYRVTDDLGKGHKVLGRVSSTAELLQNEKLQLKIFSQWLSRRTSFTTEL